MDTRLYKEVQQAASGPNFFRGTGEERANPQLSSGMSASNKSMPIYSASFIIHSKSASGHDASADSTAKADPGTTVLNDSLPPQQESHNDNFGPCCFYLVSFMFCLYQLKYNSQQKPNLLVMGWKLSLLNPKSGTTGSVKESEEIQFGEIKLKDLARLVPNVQTDFIDLDSLEDDPIIVVDDSEDEGANIKKDNAHIDETEDTSDQTPSLPRRAPSRITNCDVLTKKGPITLKVYKEDDESEIIPNFKASDLHLGEWTEGSGIYVDKPRGKQDPLNKLNDLAKKKRKHVDDIHDYFKANKRLKSSVQYEDHLVGTILNEPVLGMIMFNSFKRHDFVTIADFNEFDSTMLYTIKEILFRLHKGLGLTNLVRIFSSYLLVEIDKRNLNLIKQMKVIEQLRQ
nr:hypothetical protein [Tanacetum cinerariifolium]